MIGWFFLIIVVLVIWVIHSWIKLENAIDEWDPDHTKRNKK